MVVSTTRHFNFSLLRLGSLLLLMSAVTVTVVDGISVPLCNGTHAYEFVSASVNWTQALDLASNSSYRGCNGYLGK